MIDFDDFIQKDFDGQLAIEVLDSNGHPILLSTWMVEQLLQAMKEAE